MFSATFDFSWLTGEKESRGALLKKPSIHEQSDGTVLGMCMTGSSSKDSLASWVKFLETKSPNLSQTPVIFLLKTPEQGLQVWEGDQDMNEKTEIALAYEHLRSQE